jgi:hypothetical protein
MTAGVTLARKYARDGYCVTPPFLPAETVQSAIAAADAVARGDYATGRAPRHCERSPDSEPYQLIKISQPQYSDIRLLEVVRHPQLGRWAAAITGRRMIQAWTVDLFIKFPSSTSAANVGWHQDASYASYWEGETLTAWIALSAVSEHSAPLRYVPASHDLGPIEGGDLYATDLQEIRGRLSIPANFQWIEAPTPVPRGAAAFHHALALHASGPNLGDAPRYALAVRLRTEHSQLTVDDLPAQLRHLDDALAAPVLWNGRAPAHADVT